MFPSVGGTIRRKVNSPGHAIKLRFVPVSPGFPLPSPASLGWAAHPLLPTKDSSYTEAQQPAGKKQKDNLIINLYEESMK